MRFSTQRGGRAPSRWLLLSPLALAASTAFAAVEGTVLSASGTPIEHVRVVRLDTLKAVYTDLHGRFRFPDATAPVELQLSHPRFVTKELEVAASDDPLEIRLEPKQTFYQDLVVTANRESATFSPVSVAASNVDPQETTTPVATVTEVVSEIPGVSQNGQGGNFQVFSIRGVSRHRVMTLVSGMRIVSDRRAGVATSFIDPLLLGSVDVVRGPSSTYYGSGALGGVMQMFSRQHEDLSVQLGYETQGDQNYQVIGWGDGAWSLGFARRVAGQSENPEGGAVADGFEQLSFDLARAWRTGKRTYTLQLISGVGRDIEKATTDYPERQTTYDTENLLVRFEVDTRESWKFQAWVHPHELDTFVVTPGFEESFVNNSSVDFGASWQDASTFGKKASVRYGVDYFARRNVDAVEEATLLDPPSDPVRTQTLFNAESDEIGLFGTAEWGWGRSSLFAGARGTWKRQANDGQEATDDFAFNPFAGIVASLGGGLELAANVGTGLRFPTLSELFFTGTTGRGEVIGNPNLDSESSLNLDLGLRWFGSKLFVEGYVFWNGIDDYIEQVEIQPDVTTFVNLVSGRIVGAELQGYYQFVPSVALEFSGHYLEGRSDADVPLGDVPANRLALGFRGKEQRWSWRLHLEHRFGKTDVSPDEKPLPAANLLTFRVSYDVTEDLALALTGRNVLDESYFNSPDRKVPLSPGRSIGLALVWNR